MNLKDAITAIRARGHTIGRCHKCIRINWYENGHLHKMTYHSSEEIKNVAIMLERNAVYKLYEAIEGEKHD